MRTLKRQESINDPAEINLALKDSILDFKKSQVNSEISAKLPQVLAKKSIDNELFFNELTHSYNDVADFTAASTNNHIKKKNLARLNNQDDNPLQVESVEDLEVNLVNANPSVKLDDNISFIEDDYEDLEDEEEDLNDGDEGLHASINQYKLKFLGSVRGMLEFKEFLKVSNFRFV